ncbi:MAG: STAS/SEC14 domain-containing protein [Pseudomonadota bacterium]
MTKPEFHATREGDNLIVIETSGKIDAVAMEVALDMLVREMDGMHHGGMLMRLAGAEWPTLGAIGVELRHWGQLMAAIEKIDKVAALTDDQMIRTAAAVESALIPNLVVKSFDLNDEAGARAWLAA